MTVTLSGNTTVCTGTSQISFTANVSGGTGSIAYQWVKNGSYVSSLNQGQPSNVFIYSSFANGDQYYCVATGTSGSATSNTLTLTVTSTQTFTVSTNVSAGPALCQNVPLTFTASGNLPMNSYQWSMNGSTIAGATASTFSTTANTVAILQSIRVTATTSASCVSNTSATGSASAIPFTITSTVTPAVSVTSGSGNAICTGSSVTFTATPVNGGSSPAYQWQSNGSNISGATSSTYSTSSLNNGQQISVVLTSNAVCPTSTTALSNAAVMTVTSTVGTLSAITGPTLVSQQGVSSYTASAANATSYNWSIAPTSAGSIDSLGNVTWGNVAFGSAIITVTPNGCNPGSQAAHLTVTPYPALAGGTILSGNMRLAASGTPAPIVANLAVGGNGSPYSYQWQQSASAAGPFTNITGDTAARICPLESLTTTTYYQRKVTCGSDIAYSNVVSYTIGAVDTLNRNYVRQRNFLRPGITDTTSAAGLTDPHDVMQTTQYFDGIGRPVQKVDRKASPLLNDMVTNQVYDPFERESVKYMPFVTTVSDGNFKSMALVTQNSFNQGQFPGEGYYYAETDVEVSPLNRVLTSYAPGNSWIAANRGTVTQYLYNALADSVRIWTIATAKDTTPISSGVYAAGQLYKNLSMDEQNHQVVEYKDKDGHIVLRKVQSVASPGTAHVGWLCTYYVYDDLDNLRYVLQPRAVELINGSWSVSASVAFEFCFRYVYDYRNRMIIKKVPGAGEIWQVYDSRDRQIMTQDSNSRKAYTWIVTKFDNLNRPDSMGILTDSNNRVYHQNLALGSTNYPVTSGSNFEYMTRTFYDDYSWVAGVTSTLSTSLATKYTSNSYYFTTNYNSGPTYAVPVTQAASAQGLVTGTITKAIHSGPFYFYAVNFYDDHNRIIQTQATNFRDGIDTVTNQYNFSGKVLRTLMNHAKKNNIVQYHKVLTKMNYDAGLRLTSVRKNIDSAANDQLIDSLQYNELGQVAKKYLGNFLDSQAYTYTIRGWLSSINKNYLASTSAAPLNYFGEELGYDKTTAAVSGTAYKGLQFNDNIAGTIWRSAGDGVNRQYDFSYDTLNRLAKADFTQQFPGGWGKTDPGNASSPLMDFSSSKLAYDANGNILSMYQMGFKLGGSVPIDSLSYNYVYNGNNSNKLNQVTDTKNDSASTLGDFHYKGTKGSYDYSYDGNGNMTVDRNKGITSISYNYLNLPEYIILGSKGNILYKYDANGVKIQKVVWDSIPRKTYNYLYCDGFVYLIKDTIPGTGLTSDTLQYIGQEEGNVRWAFHKYTNGTTGYRLEYDFMEKDHLGNTRALLSQEKDTTKYVATMEGAYRATENALFYNIPATVVARTSVPSPGYPVDTTMSNPNDSVAKVNGSGNKQGPAIILKVMAGDTIDIMTQYYYNNVGGSTDSTIHVQDILGSLANGIVSMTGVTHGTLGQLMAPGNPLSTALNSFITSNNSIPSGKPAAYLNWILLDNQFNYVSIPGEYQSGALPVLNYGQASGKLQPPLAQSNIVMRKSGFLYIYVSNSTKGWDVFFDNLTVKMRTGPMLEENHYYPYGLTMAGISDKALKTQYTQNKHRYNGKELQNQEFSDGTGLEEYDFGARLQDPQLGLWHNIDRHSDNYTFFTPYGYALGNPLKFVDPTGMDTHLSGQAAQDYFASLQSTMSLNSQGWKLPTDIDNLDKVAQGVKNENGGESDDNFTIKGIYPVYESITPTIYHHILEAQDVEGYPRVLRKDDPALTDIKRRQVTGRWGSPRPKGFSVDEYPMASTMEGGFYNGRFASSVLVPIEEQINQGIQVGGLLHSLQYGNRFLVQPINDKWHPEPEGVAYYIESSGGERWPSDTHIYAPRYRQPQNNPAPYPIASPFGFGQILNFLVRGLEFAL